MSEEKTHFGGQVDRQAPKTEQPGPPHGYAPAAGAVARPDQSHDEPAAPPRGIEQPALHAHEGPTPAHSGKEAHAQRRKRGGGRQGDTRKAAQEVRILATMGNDLALRKDADTERARVQ